MEQPLHREATREGPSPPPDTPTRKGINALRSITDTISAAASIGTWVPAYQLESSLVMVKGRGDLHILSVGEEKADLLLKDWR